MTKLAVCQTLCKPGDVPANVAQGLDLIAAAGARGAELIVLPECHTTGLTANLRDLAETVPGPTTEVYGVAAREAGAWVVAGIVEREDGQLYNTAIVLAPTGSLVAKYRKCYLYVGEREGGFCPGDTACVLDVGFVTAGVAICYDYVFAEYLRDLVVRGARLLVHPTAWVDTASCRQWRYPAAEAYRAQCLVRALENGVFFASANHCGPYDEDGHLQAVGRSAIIAPWGEVLAEVAEGPGVAVAEADFSRIEPWAQTAAPYLHDFLTCPRPI